MPTNSSLNLELQYKVKEAQQLESRLNACIKSLEAQLQECERVIRSPIQIGDRFGGKSKNSKWSILRNTASFITKAKLTSIKKQTTKYQLEIEEKVAETKANGQWTTSASTTRKRNDLTDGSGATSDNDRVALAFQAHAHNGILLERKLNDSLSLLGLAKYHKNSDSNVDLNLAGFRKVVDSAIRRRFIETILVDISPSLADMLETKFPPKIENLTQNFVNAVISGKEYTSLAARLFSESLNKIKSATSVALFDDTCADPDVRGPPDLQAVMNKYISEGGYVGQFGDDADFNKGLEARIGLPDPCIFKAMLREHMVADDSDQPFETSNYNIVTTPKQEFALLLGESQEYYDQENGTTEKIPVLLQQLPQELRPSNFELSELEQEFAKLRDENKTLSSKHNLGRQNDYYLDSLIEFSVKSVNLDSDVANKQLERFLLEELGVMRIFVEENMEEACRKIRSKSGPRTEDSLTTMTVLIPLDATDKWLASLKDKMREKFEVDLSSISARIIDKHVHVYTLEGDFQRKFEMQDYCHIRRQARKLLSLKELMGIRAVVDAKLRVEEAIAAYMYTGPLFQKWNAALRNKRPSCKEFSEGRYVTTIHTLVSAVLKLSTITKLPEGRKVMRGLGGMALGMEWLSKNERGTKGAVELGFLSTTTNRDLALEYSGASTGRGIAFEIEVGAVDCGANLESLSQYPGEGEMLFGPLCYLEVVGDPSMEIVNGKEVVIVRLKINKNMRAMSIEDMIGKRKKFLAEITENFLREIRFDLKILQLDLTDAMVSKQLQEVLIETRNVQDKDASWFNHDKNFGEVINQAIDRKEQILVKILTNVGHSTGEKGNIALFNMAKRGRGDLISALIESQVSDLTAKDQVHQTALHHAAMNGHVEAVRVLCQAMKSAGMDVNPKDTYQKTPLKYASDFQHTEVVRVLLEEFEAQADANEKDELWEAGRAATLLCRPERKNFAEHDSKAADEQADKSAFIRLLGDSLLLKNGNTVPTEEALKGKSKVGLYFSGHWCPPCRRFTPMLADLYRELRDAGEAGFEVVFVSSDSSASQFQAYFAEMPWVAVPFEKLDEVSDGLSEAFEVEGIPHLAILDADGSTVNPHANALVHRYGDQAFPFTDDRVREVERQVKERSDAALAALATAHMPALLGGPLDRSVRFVCLVLGGPDPDRGVTALAKALPAVDAAHPGALKVRYIPWEDADDPAHDGAACAGLPVVRLADPAARGLVQTAIGEPISAPQLLLLACTARGGLEIAETDAWRPVLVYGARGFPWTPDALQKMVDDLRARAPRLQYLKTAGRDTLQRGVGAAATSVAVDAVAAGADIVGLYFSASWCGPCRHLTPRLARAYGKLRAAGERFEVVFVSSDKGEADFEEYYGSMPWLALPFAERDLRTDLSSLYDVSGIPTLVLLDAGTGRVITEEGAELFRSGDGWPFKTLQFADILCDK